MKKWKLLIFVFLAIAIIFVFKKKNSYSEKFNPINIYRFEQSLFATNNSTIEKDILEWEKQLGTFFESFNYEVLRTNSKQNSYQNQLLDFISHPDMKEAFDSVSQCFADIDFLEKEFATSFAKYKEIFPEKTTPTVITYFSGFNYGVVTNDSILAVGLDYFLGKNSVFYKRLNIPEYLSAKSKKSYILPYSFETIATNEFGVFDNGNDFLSQMIFKGKIMYFLDAVLPNVSTADKLRFSEQELKWCENSEASIWAYFIDNELLFSADIKKFKSYLYDSPFAKGMPKESPGKIAYFMGWKIVKKYMKKNPNISLQELMQNTKSQEILQQSKYKP